MFNTYYIKHNKYIEQIKEDIDAAEQVISKSGDINFKSFDLHDELNTKIWDDNDELQHDIREDLINIASDFYDTLDISEITEEGDPDEKPDKTFSKYIKDVLLVGSLASFNYSSYADIDLHLLMDENKLVGKNKLALNILKKYFTECKNDWNLKHTDLKIKGYDVELYVQDVNEENASNGVYSLMKDKWIKYPKKLKTENFDKTWIEKKALDYIEQIDNLEETIHSHSDLDLVEKAHDELKKIKDKIVQGRRDSLAAGQGEMNKYNILFKILRRSGHIGKINELTLKAYDLLKSFESKNDFKKESTIMKNKEEFVENFINNAFRKDDNGNDIDWQGNVVTSVNESEDEDIAEFEKMYGPNASKALTIYLTKRSNKTADFVLNDDDEFDKFANWAYKHLGIDVYEKFAKYDTGSFYKRTSDLYKFEEPKKSDSVRGDDTRFSYEVDDVGGDFDRDDTIDWDKEFPDTQEESIVVTEDGESRLEKIIDILNTRWAYPDDYDFEDEPYKYRFVISTEVNKAAKILDNALKEYAMTGNKKAFRNKVDDIQRMYCSVDVPDDIIDSYAIKFMNLVDVKGESIVVVEDDENVETTDNTEETARKPKIILGDEDGELTFVLTPNEPEENAISVLKKYNDLAKEQYKANHDGNEEGFVELKWEKDPEYSYWYFIAPKPIADVKKDLESEFNGKFEIEIQELKVKENTEEQQVEQENQTTNQQNSETPENNQTTQFSSQQNANQQPVDQNNSTTSTQNDETSGQPQQTQESESAPKITGTSWEDFLKNVEEQSIYKVDSAFKRHPNQWVELIDDTGKIYDGEITAYSDGTFELLYSNIHPVPNAEESKKKTPINESYSDDMIDNIKSVLKRYFEVDPETEEENPEFDENFTAQDAIDEIIDILY